MISVTLYQPTVGPTAKSRKSPTWRIKWRTPDGKVHTATTGTRNKEIAETIRRKKIEQLALDPWGIEQKRTLMPQTISDLTKSYIANAERTKRKHTALAYQQSLTHLKRIVGDRYVHGIDTKALREFIELRREEGVKVATVNKDLRTIRAFLNYAVEQMAIGQPPNFKGLMLREDRKAPKVVEKEIRNKVYKALLKKDLLLKERSPEWWMVMFMLLERLGLRRNEALSLTWGNIDLAAGKVLIAAEGSKGRSDRILPMGPELKCCLSSWKQGNALDTAPVLPWDKNTVRRLYEDWKLILEAAKLPGSTRLVPKDLRSTCGSELIEAGVPTVVVKDWLGHSTVTTTERHYINTGKSLNSAMEAREKLGKKLPKRRKSG